MRLSSHRADHGLAETVGGVAGGKLSKELQVQADIEGVAATLLLVVLPASLYAVLHSSMLAEWVHLWSLMLLASLPVLFLSIVEVRL